MRSQDIEIGKRYQVEYFGIIPATVLEVVPGQVKVQLKDPRTGSEREVQVSPRQVLGRAS